MIDGWAMRMATPDDLPAVVSMLNEAGARLADMGHDQWGRDWMTTSRMAAMVERRETYVAAERGRIMATVTLSEDPGPFWTPEERNQSVIYMGKLARRTDSPRGIGTWIANVWVPGWAYANGYDIVRLDAWLTNDALHEYYRSRGWKYIRTEHAPDNLSGVLFERTALPAPAQVSGTCDA